MVHRMTAAEQHKRIMSGRSLPEDTIQFVDSLEDPIVCEWLYLCALDGMPLEHLKKLSRIPDKDSVRKGDYICAERKKYLQSVFKNPEAAASKSVEAMFQQVREMYEESKSLRAMVDENIRKSQKEQNKSAKANEAAQTALLQEKQNIIDNQERYIRQLEKSISEMENEKEEWKEKKASEAAENEKAALKRRLMETKMGSWIVQQKKKRDSQKFVDTYLKEDTYSEEQKEYLLQCFEDGASLRDMEKFASPDIPVILMERLRKANV